MAVLAIGLNNAHDVQIMYFEESVNVVIFWFVDRDEGWINIPSRPVCVFV